MSKHRDSNQRIALVQRFAEGHAAPEEIQVAPTGKWDHPVYGEMEITSADIAKFVENFKAKVRNDLPISDSKMLVFSERSSSRSSRDRSSCPTSASMRATFMPRCFARTD